MVERKIGDIVYIKDTYQERIILHVGRITKVTKTRRFNVVFNDVEKQFLENGKLVSASGSYFAKDCTIITKNEYELLLPIAKEQKTRRILSIHAKNINKTSIDINKSTLIEKLERMLVLANELQDANNE